MYIVLNEKEYEELKSYRNIVFERMDDLQELVNDKDALQEYVKEWLAE